MFKKLSLLLIMLSPTLGIAATIPGVVNENIDPARVQQRFDQEIKPLARHKGIALPRLTDEEIPEEFKKITFTLKSVKIKGVSTYSKKAFQYLYADKLNKKISVNDLFDMAKAISVHYRNDGYILSQAFLPEQVIEKGDVVIEVVEGYIDAVSVDGTATRANRALIKAYGDKIMQSKPLSMRVLERYTLLANDLPGVTARAVLSPSKKNVGASHLSLVLTHKANNFTARVDNRGTKLIGPYQFIVSRYTNGLTAGSTTGARAIVSSQTNELVYFDATHEQRLGSNGMIMTVNIGRSGTEPTFNTADLRAIGIEGELIDTSVQVSYPFVRSRKKNFSLQGGLRITRSTTSSRALNTIVFDDRIRLLTLTGLFDYADSFKGITLFEASIHKGLNILSASPNGSPTLSRAGARNDPTYISGQLRRIQSLWWGFSLHLSGRGQYAFNNSLYSQLEMGVGGSQYGRGYDASEITGDHGIAGKIQLEYEKAFGHKYFQTLQLYYFYDAGVVWNINYTSQPRRQSLASTGGGFRIFISDYLSGFLELAKPLTRNVSILGNKKLRVFFGVTLSL